MKKIFTAKLVTLYICLIIAGFFLGYDYSVISSRNEASAEQKAYAAQTLTDINREAERLP